MRRFHLLLLLAAGSAPALIGRAAWASSAAVHTAAANAVTPPVVSVFLATDRPAAPRPSAAPLRTASPAATVPPKSGAADVATPEPSPAPANATPSPSGAATSPAAAATPPTKQEAPADATPTPAAPTTPAASPQAAQPSDAWQRWAHLDADGGRIALAVSCSRSPAAAAGISAEAVRFLHGFGARLTNAPGAPPVELHIGVPLDTGVWRIEAALAGPSAGVRSWRMESVFLPHAAAAYKSVRLGPGETVIVRWTETLAEADAACRAAQHSDAAQGGPTTYTGVTIARALADAADLIGQAETLTHRGRREDVVRRAQSALLLVAQAQAMALNRPEAADGGADDRVLQRLTTALSEVSCAACNLIPAESAVTDASGAVVGTRVSVTNAGDRTIPLVSLALPEAGEGAGLTAPGQVRTVFRNLAPGATVTTRLPAIPHPVATAKPAAAAAADGPISRAVLQFIIGMGAAVVPAGIVP